jgi:hypothetical protein
MPRSFPHPTFGPRAKSKYISRFYITIGLISAFAILTYVADQSARYSQGSNYGVAGKRAVAELAVDRLLKRDQEVCGTM